MSLGPQLAPTLHIVLAQLEYIKTLEGIAADTGSYSIRTPSPRPRLPAPRYLQGLAPHSVPKAYRIEIRSKRVNLADMPRPGYVAALYYTRAWWVGIKFSNCIDMLGCLLGGQLLQGLELSGIIPHVYVGLLQQSHPLARWELAMPSV